MNSKFLVGLLAGIVVTLLLSVLFMSGMMNRGGMMRQDDMMQDQGNSQLRLKRHYYQ